MCNTGKRDRDLFASIMAVRDEKALAAGCFSEDFEAYEAGRHEDQQFYDFIPFTENGLRRWAVFLKAEKNTEKELQAFERILSGYRSDFSNRYLNEYERKVEARLRKGYVAWLKDKIRGQQTLLALLPQH